MAVRFRRDGKFPGLTLKGEECKWCLRLGGFCQHHKPPPQTRRQFDGIWPAMTTKDALCQLCLRNSPLEFCHYHTPKRQFISALLAGLNKEGSCDNLSMKRATILQRRGGDLYMKGIKSEAAAGIVKEYRQVDHIIEKQIAVVGLYQAEKNRAQSFVTDLSRALHPEGTFDNYNVTTKAINKGKGEIVTSYLHDENQDGLHNITLDEKVFENITVAMNDAFPLVEEAFREYRVENCTGAILDRTANALRTLHEGMKILDVD